jgi:hypothetical protein
VEAKPSLITKMKDKDKTATNAYPSNKIQITINVDDDNDNSPAFSPSKIIKCSKFVTHITFYTLESFLQMNVYSIFS